MLIPDNADQPASWLLGVIAFAAFVIGIVSGWFVRGEANRAPPHEDWP